MRRRYAQDWLAETFEDTGNNQAGWRTDPAQAGAGCCIGDIGTHAFNFAALDAGHLASAVLDVLAQEPPPSGHPLLAHPRVIVTPHVASMTHPATTARQVTRAVRMYRDGLPLDDVVDRRRGY